MSIKSIIKKTSDHYLIFETMALPINVGARQQCRLRNSATSIDEGPDNEPFLIRIPAGEEAFGCVKGQRFPFVLIGFGEASHCGVLMAAYSAASNWRRNPTMSKTKPYTLNGKAR